MRGSQRGGVTTSVAEASAVLLVGTTIVEPDDEKGRRPLVPLRKMPVPLRRNTGGWPADDSIVEDDEEEEEDGTWSRLPDLSYERSFFLFTRPIMEPRERDRKKDLGEEDEDEAVAGEMAEGLGGEGSRGEWRGSWVPMPAVCWWETSTTTGWWGGDGSSLEAFWPPFPLRSMKLMVVLVCRGRGEERTSDRSGRGDQVGTFAEPTSNPEQPKVPGGQ